MARCLAMKCLVSSSNLDTLRSYSTPSLLILRAYQIALRFKVGSDNMNKLFNDVATSKKSVSTVTNIIFPVI